MVRMTNPAFISWKVFLRRHSHRLATGIKGDLGYLPHRYYR